MAYVETFAGMELPGFADGSLSNSQFAVPSGLAADPRAKTLVLFVADSSNNRIRRIDTTMVSTYAGSTASLDDGTAVVQDGPARLATFSGPTDLVMDSQGTLYVADSLSRKIRVIHPH